MSVWGKLFSSNVSVHAQYLTDIINYITLRVLINVIVIIRNEISKKNCTVHEVQQSETLMRWILQEYRKDCTAYQHRHGGVAETSETCKQQL